MIVPVTFVPHIPTPLEQATADLVAAALRAAAGPLAPKYLADAAAAYEAVVEGLAQSSGDVAEADPASTAD